MKKLSYFFKNLGPGLITGAADDDPSGIATYSQAGARFGLTTIWAVILTYPLMVGIQIISARIGCVTKEGLSYNIKKYFPRSFLWFILFLLYIANTINIAADLKAMGNTLSLFVPVNGKLLSLFFGFFSLLLQIFVPYTKYSKILKWLTLVLFTYILNIFFINVSWREVLRNSLTPTIHWSSSYLTTLVALFGTTISPYLFFWQASQEVEEKNISLEKKESHSAPIKKDLKRIKIDTYIGMAFSNIIAFFIILTAVMTFHKNGVYQIETAIEAAQALKPIAGDFAYTIFCIGIIGTGLLSIPILIGSSAYALAEALDMKKRSMELEPSKAKKFYSIIAISALAGMILTFLNINPIKALFYSAVINGIVAVPIMATMLFISSNPKIMNQYTIHKTLKILGWITVAIMLIIVLLMIALSF